MDDATQAEITVASRDEWLEVITGDIAKSEDIVVTLLNAEVRAVDDLVNAARGHAQRPSSRTARVRLWKAQGRWTAAHTWLGTMLSVLRQAAWEADGET